MMLLAQAPIAGLKTGVASGSAGSSTAGAPGTSTPEGWFIDGQGWDTSVRPVVRFHMGWRDRTGGGGGYLGLTTFQIFTCTAFAAERASFDTTTMRWYYRCAPANAANNTGVVMNNAAQEGAQSPQNPILVWNGQMPGPITDGGTSLNHIRFWAGWTNLPAIAGQILCDVPSCGAAGTQGGRYCMVRYSADAGDSTFKLCSATREWGAAETNSCVPFTQTPVELDRLHVEVALTKTSCRGTIQKWGGPVETVTKTTDIPNFDGGTGAASNKLWPFVGMFNMDSGTRLDFGTNFAAYSWH